MRYINIENQWAEITLIFRPCMKYIYCFCCVFLAETERRYTTFFVDPAKTIVTGNYYTKHLPTQLIPVCTKLYPGKNFIFQQDGASSHTHPMFVKCV